MTNLRRFGEDLDKAFKKKILAPTIELQKAIAQDLFEKLSTDTRDVNFRFGSPILTGQLRNNMKISIGVVDKSFTPLPNPDEDNPAGPNKTADEVSRFLQRLKLFESIFISNSVPYIRRIEFEGFSPKAPEGVFRVSRDATIDKFKRINKKQFVKR